MKTIFSILVLDQDNLAREGIVLWLYETGL